MSYLDLPYKTPYELLGKHPNSKILIVSNGSSTKAVLDRKSILKQYFDAIICVNHGFKYFDDVIDYHLVTEKPGPNNHVAEMLSEQEYRIDVPRIINWKGLSKYDKRYNLHKIVRCPIKQDFDIRKYKQKGYEGMLTGKPNKRNMAVGSVTLSAMHLATILGAKEIYLIGADLVFKGQFDHFYPDNQYRDKKEQDKLKPVNQVHIVEVEHIGRKFITTDYFRDTANCINDMINTTFSSVDVYDFSDGLITAAKPLNPTEFFK